jgi:spore coat polysaccharide biosynthesis predicted glycosyltransferase SpsG
VVADGGVGAGLGHLSRAGAVAVALRAKGCAVSAYALGSASPIEHDGRWSPAADLDACDPPTPGGVVVLDSYVVDVAAARERFADARLVAMHDGLVDPAQPVDLTITLVGQPGVGRLAGTEYACLRPEYWGAPDAETTPSAVRSVLVTAGGGGVPVEIAKAIADRLPQVEVVLVVGALTPSGGESIAGIRLLDRPRSLIAALRAADVVVTAGGQTVLESLACGRTTVAVETAENQRRQLDMLAEARALVVVDPPEPDRVAAIVEALAVDAPERARFAAAGRRLIDGNGALRVAYAIERIVSEGSACA